MLKQAAVTNIGSPNGADIAYCRTDSWTAIVEEKLNSAAGSDADGRLRTRLLARLRTTDGRGASGVDVRTTYVAVRREKEEGSGKRKKVALASPTDIYRDRECIAENIALNSIAPIHKSMHIFLKLPVTLPTDG